MVRHVVIVAGKILTVLIVAGGACIVAMRLWANRIRRADAAADQAELPEEPSDES